MNIPFAKYHALGNDFFILESSQIRIIGRCRPALVRQLCDRQMGVGADGVVWLSASRRADRTFQIYNADGCEAEMSGNGLRIAGQHLLRQAARRRSFTFECGTALRTVRVGAKQKADRLLSCDLGQPEFSAAKIPVKSRQKYIINQPMKFGPLALPVTAVATGNPHIVLIVDNFDFDWPALGEEIENAPQFPKGTNVEFVKVISERKLEVKLWERGVGQTSASGTGAAAAVVTTIMLGITKRRCRVQFETGQVEINWPGEHESIELSGPVSFIASGEFDFSG